jgi:hypothetical protein
VNTMFFKFTSFFLSLTALTLVSAVSAKADTMNSAPVQGNNATAATQSEPANLQSSSDANAIAQPTLEANIPNVGTANTSAADLKVEPVATTLPQMVNQPSTNSEIAQTDITPGRATRSGSSYIGIAGNIGLAGGNTALGRGNFAVISKIGLTNTFSARPAAIIGDETTFLLPITYDFTPKATDPFERVTFAPYLGAGALVNTNGDVGFLVSGGADFPLTSQFTATAGVNVGIKDQTEVGLLLGVGYNFSGF